MIIAVLRREHRIKQHSLWECCDHARYPQDVDDAFDVVSQHAQAHFSTYFIHPAHQEVALVHHDPVHSYSHVQTAS